MTSMILNNTKELTFENHERKALTAVEPHWVEMPGHGSYGNNNYNMLPYQRIDDVANMVKLGIDFKFDRIISLHEGKSTCKACGSVYAGKQIKCTHAVRYVSGRDNRGYARGKKSNSLYLGDRFSEWNDYYVVDSISTTACDEFCTWDLQERFDKQVRLFDLVRFIAQYKEMHLSNFKEFSDVVPAHVFQETRAVYTAMEVQSLRMQMDQVKGALSQIASKMNAAGSCLSFGF